MNLRGRHIDIGKLLHSFVFFVTNIFIKRSYDIVFYYPAHFNREGGKNPYFQNLYDACIRHNISFIVLEEPTFHIEDSRNKDALPFDFPFLTIILLQKFYKKKKYSALERERKIAKILKPLFFRKFEFKYFVVLSQSMISFFRGIDSKAEIYDYQHGIIHPFHLAYITENGTVPDTLYNNDANVLLYGKGFLQCLIESDKTGYYKEHALVIGSHFAMKKYKIVSNRPRTILFSSTIVDDEKKDRLKQYYLIYEFFYKNRSFFEYNGIKLLFKHHPRYQNDIDMEDLFRLPFVETCTESLQKALENSFLHMTLTSTTIFEASGMGIPSIIWNTHFPNIEKIFVQAFDFPLGVLKEDEIVPRIKRYIEDGEKYSTDSHKVHRWYENFYSTFTEDRFLALFKTENEEKQL